MQLNTSPASDRSQAAMRGSVVHVVGCLFLMAIFSMGCHKAADTTAAVPPVVAGTNQDSQTAVADTESHAPVPRAVVADPNAPPPVKPNGDPDLHQLDRAMLRWLVANQRRPSSFAEFAASAGVAIPPPPPGKKYALNQGLHVILVNQ